MNATFSDQVKKIDELLKKFEFVMMTTVDLEGHFHSRPMVVSHKQNLLTGLCFLTTRTSPKYNELNHDHRVNLSFSDFNKQTFISISGTANIYRDEDKIKQIWTSEHAKYFPEGVDDPNLYIIQVIPENAEYWDEASALFVKTIEFARMVSGKKVGDVVENDKVSLTDISPI